MNKKNWILVTGGAGYIGSMLVQRLLLEGYKVRVIDLFMYGKTLQEHPNLSVIKMDIRNPEVFDLLDDSYVVFHFAGVSNDPGYGLSRETGRQINLDLFEPLLKESKRRGVERFIFPSSCSVYGNTSDQIVTELTPVQPLTEYAYCKVKCEEMIYQYADDTFCCPIVRPATVCGVSNRQRFDLLVNSFVNEAYFRKKIEIKDSKRIRPSIHIQDLISCYLTLLEAKPEKINRQVYNLAFENRTVLETAELVKKTLDNKVSIEMLFSPGWDKRSYAVSSQKWITSMNFKLAHTVADAVNELRDALNQQRFKDTFTNSLYHNRLRQPQFLT